MPTAVEAFIAHAQAFGIYPECELNQNRDTVFKSKAWASFPSGVAREAILVERQLCDC